jgi:hypothetical protein
VIRQADAHRPAQADRVAQLVLPDVDHLVIVCTP